MKLVKCAGKTILLVLLIALGSIISDALYNALPLWCSAMIAVILLVVLIIIYYLSAK